MDGRDPLTFSTVAINATPVYTLATTQDRRRDPTFQHARDAVLVLTGGTGDVSANHSAATIISDMRTYCQTAKTAGAGYVINATIPPFDQNAGLSGTPYTLNPAWETQRLATNALIRSHAGDPTYWDACLDLAGDTRFQNINNPTYYFDGVHFADAGHAAAAELCGPLLDRAIATFTF